MGYIIFANNFLQRCNKVDNMKTKTGKVSRTVYLTKEMDQLLVQRARLTLRTISSEIECLIRKGLAAQQNSDMDAINISDKPTKIQVTLGAEGS